METAKYLAEQERIARIAFKLFAKTGYSKTPLSVIGEAAGVQKSLLQYYFPKKAKFIELFIETSINVLIDHVEKHVTENVDAAETNGIDAVDPFNDEDEGLSGMQLLEMIYRVAYFEFWYVTTCPSTKALRMDVMESRDNTQMVVKCVCDWIFSNMDALDDNMKETIYDSVTFCIGGGFEYACTKLAAGERVKVDRIVNNAMDFMVSSMGFDPTLFRIRMDITDEWLRETAKAVDALTFGLDD